MLAKALLLSALSGGGPGAPDLSQSVVAPAAPAPGTPSPGAGSPLSQVLLASNTQPKDDVPDVDPAKAKEFEKGATKSGLDFIDWENLKKQLGLGTKK